MATQLETDYLVVGAGAASLAFVDTLVDETDADVVIVDRYDKPGGHWRVAYDFVRLHQPSGYYGVNSRPLGRDRIEPDGYNAGLLELASVDEICDYYDQVMVHTLLPSGRVRYLPNSEFLGDGRVRRILSGEEIEISSRIRTVDGTYSKVTVPSMVPPPFDVKDDASVVPPGGLVRLTRGYDRYVVVGSGKTGIDTVLWLLQRGTAPEQISWVMPRDAWLYNREICQPGPEFIEISDVYAEGFFDAWTKASSIEELYDRLVDAEYLMRFSPDVRPTAFRCATVTRTELEALRSVGDVIRLGRVLEVNADGLVLEHGARRLDADVMYIDCTANGLAQRPSVPVFQTELITLEPLFECQQVYSASFIAHVEARFDDDDAKNRLTAPVPHPDREIDFIANCAVQFRSELLWIADPEIVQWRQDARLAGVATRVGTPLPPAGPERETALEEYREGFETIVAKADQLLAQIEASERATSAPPLPQSPSAEVLR
jgi:hypothetical protein